MAVRKCKGTKSEPEPLTPTERMALADLSTDELTEQLNAVLGAIRTAQKMIEEGKKRAEQISREVEERRLEAHRGARKSFACPSCGNADISRVSRVSPFTDVSPLKWGQDKLLIMDCACDDGPVLAHVDGEIKKVVPISSLYCCECSHLWQIDENIITEWE